MKPIIEDIQKTMPGVEPVFNHHMSVSNALRKLSNHFFEIGMKLRKSATDEQRKKYTEATDALIMVRGAVAQNFIHETELNAHEQNVRVLQQEIYRLKKENESLKQQIEFLQP